MIRENFNLEKFVALARHIGSDTSDVEVKAASGGLSKSIAETLSAFSNASGGMVVLGLSEEDGFCCAEGFDAKRIAAALAQNASDKMEPPVRAEIDIEEFEEGLVVCAYIPEMPPYLKPCYIKARGLYEGSYVRTGEGDRKLSRYEVDRLQEERRQPRFDAEPVMEASPEDLDPELVAGFLRRERAMSPRVFAGLGDRDALLTMGVLKKDEQGDVHPTLAGLMALARHPQQFYPRANVTFAVMPGTTKEGLAADGARFIDARTIIGPIPAMVSDTLAAVRRNSRMRTYVEGGARIEVPEYPEVAIREAVANALMHRDYSPEGLGAQVQVNMYSDRIEIINPGGLYGTVTVDNIGQYGASSSRNQFLSRILESTPYPADALERGYVVENKGTGFAQIQRSLREAGLPPAEPQDSLSLFVMRIRRSLGGQTPGSSPDIDRTDAIILEVAGQAGGASASEISDALGVSRSTSLRYIDGLVAAGTLRRTGRGRSTRYMLAS